MFCWVFLKYFSLIIYFKWIIHLNYLLYDNALLMSECLLFTSRFSLFTQPPFHLHRWIARALLFCATSQASSAAVVFSLAWVYLFDFEVFHSHFANYSNSFLSPLPLWSPPTANSRELPLIFWRAPSRVRLSQRAKSELLSCGTQLPRRYLWSSPTQ